jgi:tripartite-type tricarboxylate transporter receptor subunit TctC
MTLAATLGAAPWAGALAQGFPSKPIRLVVPFTPGSATDIMGRTVGDRVAANLGQPVIVENRPGAGGVIGTGMVAKSPPDGYTLVVVSSGHVTNPVLYGDKLTYELKDLAGVVPLGSLPSVLIASPQSGIKSVKELVDTLKAKPGQLNFSSAGIGSAAHVNAEKFKASLGFDAVHVPLKGTPEILLEIASGRVQFGFVPLVSSVGPIRDGKVVAIGGAPRRARCRRRRWPRPATPVASTTSGRVLAPAGTPKDVMDKLTREFAGLSRRDQERFAKIDAVPMPMSPGQFDATILSGRKARTHHESGRRQAAR